MVSIVRSVKFVQKGVGVTSIVRYYLATSASSGVTTSTSGWTTSVQVATSTKKYLWTYDKTTLSDGTVSNTVPIISSTWSGPVLPYPAGEYDNGKTYTATDKTAPYVLLDDIYYVMNKTGSSTGINPETDYAANGTNATWIPFENFKAAFVEILMANFAKLASAVFYGDYMFSQQGVDANGNATSDYSAFGTADFTPNFLINFLTGLMRGKNVEIEGTIKAVSGLIGSLSIVGNSLISDSMEFSESPVESLSSLKTPLTVSISRQSSWTDEPDGNAYTQALVLTMASTVTFKVSTTSPSAEKSWSVYIVKTGSGTVYSVYGSGEINKTFTVVLSPGEYVIHATSGDPVAGFAKISGVSNVDAISAVGYANRTKIGNNGFYSFWSSNKYLYFSSTDGLEIMFGAYGLKISTSGIQKTTNTGSTWTSL